MKITVTRKESVEVKTIAINAGVRYWEDATINGKDAKEDGSDVPCKVNDGWCPAIDLDTGVIQFWPRGTTANIHFKVCDEFNCALLDSDENEVHEYSGYVPDFMSPAGSGHGDYIIMVINETGEIEDWDFEFGDIQDEN